MTKLRKFFASSVMVMTVVVMSGLTAPMTTNAAASAGDLIKKDGLSAVYYLGEDGKRYVFPNEATYKSWYSDFSGVVTISADELASYPLGGNVVVRPGTKLVKITTDPKVYAVEANGTLRQIPNEAAAIALYGADWAKRVIDVADSFFTNYTIGSPLASNEVPMGSLVKKTGETSIYYYDGTNYRLIEDEVAFLANRFQYANVLTLSSFTAGGSTITGAEAGIIKTSQGGSTGVVNPGQGSGVTVSLNSMTPASQSVPSTVGRIPFAKVNLTASADGIAYVESITVTRTGLTTIGSGDVFRVWAEKNGVSVASKRSLSSDKAILTFSPVLSIPAGQTVTLDILAEVAGVEGNGALGIASASDISASGSTISGSFPINGNLMSFTTYNVTKLAFAPTLTNSLTGKVGDEAIELGRFNVNFASNTKDVILSSLVLKNTGNEDLVKTLMNVYLENNGEKVTNNATFDGRYMTLTFSNGGFDMLKDDGDQSFIIKGDVIGNENASGKIQFIFNKDEDLVAHEKATGFGTSYTDADNTTVFSTITMQSGAVDLSKKSTSPSAQSVIKGAKSVVALIANVRADEAINADSLVLHYEGDENSFQNAKVYLNNALLGSFDLASGVAYGTPKTERVDSSLTLNKGNNEIKITVDVKTTATTSPAAKFKASLSSSDLLTGAEYVSNGVTATVTGTATGADITVSGGGITFVRNDGYTDGKKIVQGATDVLLGKFALKATDDNIKLTNIVLTRETAAGTTSTPDSSIYDMKIKVDGSQIGSTRDFTSAGATFSSLNYSISKNTTKVIELYGSFDSSAAGVATTSFGTKMEVNAQDSLGKTIDAQNDKTVMFEVTAGGSLKVERDADSPKSNILIANATEQEIARFKFTATDDSANITEFTVTNASTSDARIASYKLYLGSTLLDESVPVSGTTTFYISSNKLVVPANGSQVVSVKALLNNIDSKDDSGKAITLTVKEGSMVVKASSGSELSQDVITGDTATSSEMIIRKTKPTFTKVGGVVAGASSEQEMLQFSISADANEDLNVTELVFDKIGASVSSVTSFKLYEVGDSSAIKEVTAQTGTTTTFASLNIRIAKGSSKTFKVVADTSSLNLDADTFGIALSVGVSGANIKWGEYFVGSYYSVSTNGQHLSTFPINGGLDTNY